MCLEEQTELFDFGEDLFKYFIGIEIVLKSSQPVLLSNHCIYLCSSDVLAVHAPVQCKTWRYVGSLELFQIEGPLGEYRAECTLHNSLVLGYVQVVQQDDNIAAQRLNPIIQHICDRLFNSLVPGNICLLVSIGQTSERCTYGSVKPSLINLTRCSTVSFSIATQSLILSKLATRTSGSISRVCSIIFGKMFFDGFMCCNTARRTSLLNE